MKFIKEDKKYYNDLGLEKALQNKDEILKELCKVFDTTMSPTIGGYYILPDGLALKAPKDHLDFDKYLIKNKLIDKNSKYLDFSDGSQFLDAFNSIRIRARGGKDHWIIPYMELPEKQPNSAQYRTLLTWLDFVFKSYNTICVENHFDNLRLYYDMRGKTPDDLIKIIKQSYITHILAEDLVKDSTKNYGYHAGDLGKSEYYSEQSGGRSTGHFGTGTYFVGDPKEIEHYNKRDGQEAPKHIVDFTSYKLYKPNNEKIAEDLHFALSLLNNYKSYFETDETFNRAVEEYKKLKKYFNIDYDKWNPKWTSVDILRGWENHKYEIIDSINTLIKYYNKLQEDSYLNPELLHEIKDDPDNSYFDETLEMTVKELVNNLYLEEDIKNLELLSDNNLINKFYMFDKDDVIHALQKVVEAQNFVKSQGGWYNSYNKNWDSLSTIFMKALGYEGIDVRHLPRFDNTTYGSVIYDVKPETIVEGLKESLKEDLIKAATPYMLRNDGKLLTCGSIHPYIKYTYEDSLESNLKELFISYPQDLVWFYKNTLKEDTKDQIRNLISSIYYADEDEFNPDVFDSAKNLLEILKVDPSKANYVTDKTEILKIFEELNICTNQEFCRVRTSSLKYGGWDAGLIYFRISSLHFNWFPLIWNIVFTHENISNITICKDTQTFGGRYDPYKIGNTVIEDLPREEFLTLKGNPVIEELKFKSEVSEDNFKNFKQGKTLSESCNYLHPRYAVGFYTANLEKALAWDLKNILQPKAKTLKEALLLEKTRQELINKSKAGDNYSPKNQAKGRNRWERRNKSRIANYVQQYNKIDMNRLFTKDELVVGINVQGETNNYVVTVRFDGAISEIQQQIKRNNNKLEFKCIVMALNRLFNLDNVYFRCTCPDFQYRQAYWATKDGYIEGTPEIRPSDITNPNNTKGGGCKHINLVLGNIDWIMKISSVINNYIHWMEENRQRQYADVMFPKLFGMPYEKAIQLDLFDTGENDLSSTENEIGLSNRFGRDRGKFRTDQIVNNQQKFTKKQIPPEDNPDQVKLELEPNETK